MFCRICSVEELSGEEGVMHYSEELIEEVRNRSDIVDVISGYVNLQKKGNNHVGLCPFHNEKTPSFSVNRQRQIYHCFGCGAGGNVITFVMEYENYSFPEALKYLADRAGVDLPEIEYSEEAKKQANEKSIILEMNKLAANYFYLQLKSERGKRGYQYFIDRKLSEQTIREFGLGYANNFSNDLYQYLKSKAYSDDIIRKSGLVNIDDTKGIYDKFWNRVMFPIMDINKRVIGFGGRVMGDGMPKYLNSPETPVFDKSRNLYGIHSARTSRKSYFILCEGYMDVIALHQAGFTNAVASLGTAFTHGQAMLIKRYVQKVYLTYDSDKAGTAAALKAVPILREVGVSAKVVRMDPYKDPDEFISNLGAEAFEERIAGARNGFMYGLEVLEQEYDMNSPEGKTSFYQEVARRLIQFEEKLERDNYIEAVSKAYKIDLGGLNKLVATAAVKKGLATPTNRPRETLFRQQQKSDPTLAPQKILLTMITTDMNHYHKVKKYLSPSDFTNPLYCDVAKILFEQLESGEMNLAKLINNFTDEETHREVTSLFHSEIRELESKQEEEKALKENLIKVKKYSVEKRYEEAVDIAELQSLAEEKRKLQELERL